MLNEERAIVTDIEGILLTMVAFYAAGNVFLAVPMFGVVVGVQFITFGILVLFHSVFLRC